VAKNGADVHHLTTALYGYFNVSKTTFDDHEDQSFPIEINEQL
jgi:hypothetical protein